MRSGCVTGVEALLRWNHPNGRVVGPDEFVPILEHSGMIVEVGAWVLRESCRQAMRWRQVGLPPLTMAVNVAAAQFRAIDMPRLVAAVLAETGLTPSWLELEITETGIMHDMRVAGDALIALHELGVGLAIDDFGTGYSSLSYLRKLPVDRVKIDRSFVMDIPASEDAAVIATAIVRLAHNLRLRGGGRRRGDGSAVGVLPRVRMRLRARLLLRRAGEPGRPRAAVGDDRRCWSARDECNE